MWRLASHDRRLRHGTAAPLLSDGRSLEDVISAVKSEVNQVKLRNWDVPRAVPVRNMSYIMLTTESLAMAK